MRALQVTILILAVGALANAQKAVLSGTVYDSQGSVIPGIGVKLKDKKGIEIATQTDDAGSYKFEVPSGYYSIVFSALSRNFEQLRVKKYYLAPSYKGNTTLDVSMVGKTTGLERIPK